MFTESDVQKLIESINVGALNETELKVLVSDTMEKLNESFTNAFEKGRAEGIQESTENIRKERLESFKRGQEKGIETLNEAVEQAEELGFKAGKEEGEEENEEKTSDFLKTALDYIEELCEVFDKYTKLVEITTREKTKEEVKESVTEALIQFCDNKVNESLPQQSIVNYHRLQQLESLNESIKKLYLINDIDVSEAVREARESCAKEFNEAKEAALYQTQKRIAAEQIAESLKAENYLLKKVRNLPSADQRILLDSFRGASIDAINESFDRECKKLRAKRTVVPSPKISDVISEAVVLNKQRERIRKNIQESDRKIKSEQRRMIKESKEFKAHEEMSNRMNQYVSCCNTLKKNGL